MTATSYRAVLSQPKVGLVLAFASMGRLAYGVVPFATVVTTARAHGFAAAGLASAVLMLAIAVPAPVRGRLVDKHGPVVLIAFACACFLLLSAAALVISHSLAAGVALTGIGGATAPPVSGAARTSWSRLIPDKAQLQQMHAADSIIEESTFVIAPLLTVSLLHLIPAAWSVIAGAALLIPAVTGLTLWGKVGNAASPHAGTATHGARSHSTLLRQATGQGIIAPLISLGVVGGSLAVLLPAGAARGGDIASAGFPFAVFSVGGIAGAFVYGRREWKHTLRARYFLTALVLTAGAIILIPAITTAFAIPAVFLAGLAMSPMYIIGFLLVDERIDAARHTEANSWIGSGYNIGSAAGSLAVGILITHVSVTWAATATAGAAALGATAALRIPGKTPDFANHPAGQQGEMAPGTPQP